MFFVVQFSALAATLVLLYFFRKDTVAVDAQGKTVVKDYFPSFSLTGMVFGLIIASFPRVRLHTLTASSAWVVWL